MPAFLLMKKQVKKFRQLLQQLVKPLTLIDYIIFTTLLLGGILFLLFFKRENTFIDIRLKVADPDIQRINRLHLDEYAVNFTSGDKELNEIGQTIAEIIQVDSYHLFPGTQATYLNMRVKANYNPKRNQYSIKGIPVAVGQSFTFTLSRVKFQGIVVNFPGAVPTAERINEKKLITVQLRDTERKYSEYSNSYGVPYYIAEAIKMGDEIKDFRGNLLVKVLKVDIKSAKRTIITSDNRAITVTDPELKDVFLVLKVNVYSQGGRLYMFDYRPVSVGQLLPIDFPNINIQSTIIEIKDSL